MSFAAALPLTGYAGWAMLKRTQTSQMATLVADPVIKRDEAYFREKISTINTAEKLVADKRLLRVALTAFGLESDVNNSFFIRKVLEEGSVNETALSGKLADKQYQKLSAAFGFGPDEEVRTATTGFADKILAEFEKRKFEAAVGDQDENLRLALNAQSSLPALAAKSTSADTKWYSVLGNAPLRKVFEKALGLPTSFSALDIDVQLQAIKSKADSVFGSSDLAQFTDSAAVETLVKRFLLRSQVDEIRAQSSQAGALSMLQQTAQMLRNR